MNHYIKIWMLNNKKLMNLIEIIFNKNIHFIQKLILYHNN